MPVRARRWHQGGDAADQFQWREGELVCLGSTLVSAPITARLAVLFGADLDPVSPKLSTLRDGWQQRLIRLARSGVTAHFLEPDGAAVSKLARAAPRDMHWVRAGIAAGLVSLPMLKLRMRATDFLDAHEQAAALGALDTLELPASADESRCGSVASAIFLRADCARINWARGLNHI